jgi:hypothetical protein
MYFKIKKRQIDHNSKTSQEVIKMTFVDIKLCDGELKNITHKVRRISLSNGLQGVPDSFHFEFHCGGSGTQNYIDLESEDK